MTDIQEIHEKCFDFLLTHYPNLPVELRQTNRYKRLEAGYWFHNLNDATAISFWNAWDWHHQTPNIYLHIEGNACFLMMVDTEKSEKERFFELIAPSLGLTKITRGTSNHYWLKTYPMDPYLQILNDFVKTEKIIIDSFIKLGKVAHLFPLTALTDYRKSLKRIEKYRQKKVVIPSIPIHAIQLKVLKLEHIGHFEAINIDLSHQVTCFIGENGSGKSTILRSIALGLTGIMPFAKEAKQLSIQRLLRLKNAASSKITYFTAGVINVIYDLDDLTNQNTVLFKSDKNLAHHSIEDAELYGQHSFNLSGEKSNLLKYLVVGFSQQTHVSLEEKNSINGINYVENPNIEDVRTLIFNKPDNRFDDVSRWFQKAVDVETPFSERKRLRAVIEKLL